MAPEPAHRQEPFILASGASRRDDAILPFKLLALDSGGALSVCESTLNAWESGPVLHSHVEVDKVFFVVRGLLEAQLGDKRVQAEMADFSGCHGDSPHVRQCGARDPSRPRARRTGRDRAPFAEQAAHIEITGGNASAEVMDQLGRKHGALTLGPPIRSANAPPA